MRKRLTPGRQYDSNRISDVELGVATLLMGILVVAATIVVPIFP